jgi:hypothetical protein
VVEALLQARHTEIDARRTLRGRHRDPNRALPSIDRMTAARGRQL